MKSQGILKWILSGNPDGAKSSKLNCKPVQEHSYPCLAVPNIYTITTFISLNINNGKTRAKKQSNNIVRTVVTQLKYRVEGLKNHR